MSEIVHSMFSEHLGRLVPYLASDDHDTPRASEVGCPPQYLVP